MNEYNIRFERQINLKSFGEESQQKLLEASVLIIGCGGLGSPAAMYLTAMGIGRLGLVDGDVVSLSNLHRQILFETADIGKSKAVVAAKRLKEINPLVEIDIHQEYIDTKSIERLVHDYDIVLDGTDNFLARYLINDACVLADKPLVYGAVSEYEGHVSLFNAPTPEGRGPNYRDLFPEPPEPGFIENCAEAGVLGIIPGIVGQLQASEVIKYVCNLGKTLSGELLVIDWLSNEQRKIKLKASSEHRVTTLDAIEDEGCVVHAISWEEWQHFAKQHTEIELIDVRTQEEREDGHAGGEHIPLDKLENAKNYFFPDKTYVFYCQTGKRSAKAIQLLTRLDVNSKMMNIEGGLEAFPF